MTKTLHLKIMLLTALFFTITISSCKKDKSLLAANATIYSINPNYSEACAWQIKTDDNNVYAATNLANEYKEDKLKVTITYRILSLPPLSCGFTPGGGGTTQIELVDIRKK